MSERSRYDSIDDYLSGIAAEVRPILQEIRQTIGRKCPDAVETISYQMPAFREGRVFIYFAAFRKHVGIYPPVKGDVALNKALQPYRGEKGNLRFPLDRPMPYELIGRVAEALWRQHAKPAGQARGGS